MHQVAIFATALLVTFCAIGYYKRSNYWRNQPVKRHSLFTHTEGKIKETEEVETDSLQLTGGERWTTVTIDELQPFLRDNYTSDYSREYLEWILAARHNSLPGCTIGLLNHSGELIGTITGRPLVMQLKDERQVGFYVDFLCVRRDQRTQGYAPHLINKIISFWKENGLDICVFYKDSRPLPIQPICELSYYVSLMSKQNDHSTTVERYKKHSFNFLPLTNKNLDIAKRLFDNFVKGYEVHEEMSLEQFKHLFMPRPGLVHTYLLYHQNKVIGFSNIVIESPKDNPQRTARVVYHITLPKRANLIHDSLLLAKLGDADVAGFYLLNLDFHRSFIRTTGAKRLDRTYFHLYNYFLNVEASQVAYCPS